MGRILFQPEGGCTYASTSCVRARLDAHVARRHGRAGCAYPHHRPGHADPWLAGMPNGSTASSGDVAPGQHPIEVLGLVFSPGDLLWFRRHRFDRPLHRRACGLAPAEGDAVEPSSGHSTGAENGIGNLMAPIRFADRLVPGPRPAGLDAWPGATLDFSTAASRDFATLAPLLKQPFFIGNGLMNDLVTVQTFSAAGATRLFLGTKDAWAGTNNVGSLEVLFDVAAAPIPNPARSPARNGAWLVPGPRVEETARVVRRGESRDLRKEVSLSVATDVSRGATSVALRQSLDGPRAWPTPQNGRPFRRNLSLVARDEGQALELLSVGFSRGA